MEFIKKTFFSSYPRVAGFLAIAAIILSIPISISLLKQKQNLNQQAHAQTAPAPGCPNFSGNYANNCSNVPCGQDAPYLYSYPGAGADAACRGINYVTGQPYGQYCCTNQNPQTINIPTPTPNLCPSGGQPIQCGGNAIICCPTAYDTCLYKSTLGYCCGSVCGNASAYPTSTPIPTPTPNPNVPTSTPIPQNYYAHCEMCPGNAQCGTYAQQTCNACNYALVWIYNCYGGTVSSTKFVADSTCNSQALCLPTNGSTPTPVQLFNTPTPVPGSATPTPTKSQTAPTPTPAPKCPLKNQGDFDCNGHINTDDFNLWRGEFLGNFSTKKSALDGVNVNTDGFNAWRAGFLNPALPH